MPAPIDTFLRFPEKNYGLNDDMLLLLHFYAYMGSDGIEKGTKAFCKEFAVSPSTVTARGWELRRKGFLKEYYYGWYERGVRISFYCFLPIAIRMLREEQGLLKTFDRMHLLRSGATRAIWELAGYCEAGDSDEILSLFRKNTLKEDDWVELLKGKLHLGIFHDVLLAIDPEAFDFLLDNTLTVDLQNQDAEALDIYAGLVAGRNQDPGQAEMADRISAYACFATGRPFKASGKKKTVYAQGVEAFNALYAREYDRAIELFFQAMKFRNKEARIKNVFDDPLMNFFLILALKAADKPEARKKMEQFRKKEICSDRNGIAAAVAIDYINTGENGKYLKSALERCLHTMGYSTLGHYLTRLLDRYLKVGLTYSLTDDELLRKSPPWAILRHELSGFMEIPGDGNPGGIFGGAPILSSIRSVPAWEITLNDIMGKLQPEKEAAKPPVRIGYFIFGNHLEVRQQKILKSGAWSSGTDVSISRFLSGDIEGLDDADRKIISHLDSRYSYSLSLESILPHLVGSDKVYTGRWAPYTPVTVTEEKPFLNVKHTKKGYAFSSNISGADSRESALVRKNGETEYIVTPFTRLQQELVAALCDKSPFPEAAADAVLRLLNSISSVIEVHSDLLEGGSSLETAAADSRIFLRVTPGSGNFDIHIYVRPLQGGSKTFFPGEGDRTVYDSADGKRFQVNRNIREEERSLAALDSCIDAGADETIRTDTAGMLDLLDFAATREDIVLEWPEGEKLRLKGSAGNVSVIVTSGEQWFDIEGDVQVGEEAISIAKILELLSSARMQGRYLPLGDGDYIKLSEALKKSLKKLEAVSQTRKGKSTVSVFQAGALAELLQSPSGIGFQTDEGLKELLGKIEKASASVPAIPKGLRAELRDYQVEGFRFMHRLTSWGGGACLADDMGLGKTVQTLALLLSRSRKGPSLVVTPASVVLNWKAETERFTPGLTAHVLGLSANRKKTVSSLKGGDVLLVSYGLLVTEQELLSCRKWNIICLDEAHTIKNRNTKMSAAAMGLESDARVILTGTPIQNHLGELWNLMQFLLPGMLGSFEAFSARYITPIEKYGDKERQGGLKKSIQPFLLRRTKADVLDELPDKTDITRVVTLTDEEMAAYETLRENARETLEQQTSMDVNALALITKLRMAACDLSLSGGPQGLPSSKLDYFGEMADEIAGAGNRALVFSQFTSFLKKAAALLEKKGLPYLYLDGSTPVRRRNSLVKEFQEGDAPLFLISLKAGGLGLNLTGANYVIHLDPWWNPAVEQQATDRAYRIGQERDVTVYHLISGHTIEEKILRLHKTKRNLADSLLEGTDIAKALTIDDLRALAAGE